MSFTDFLKGDLVTGLLIGIGVVIVAPVVLSVLAGVAKPLADGVVKGGMILYEKGKEAVAEVGEMFGDIVAESKAEFSEGQLAAAGGIPAEMTAETEQTGAGSASEKAR